MEMMYNEITIVDDILDTIGVFLCYKLLLNIKRVEVHLNLRNESCIKIDHALKKQKRMEKIQLCLFVMGNLIQFSIMMFRVFAIELLYNDERSETDKNEDQYTDKDKGQYKLLIILRIVNFVFSIIIFTFNTYMLIVFSNVLKFLLNTVI